MLASTRRAARLSRLAASFSRRFRGGRGRLRAAGVMGVAAALVCVFAGSAWATTQSGLEDDASAWGIYVDQHPGTGQVSNVSSPSQDSDNSLEISLLSGQPYVGILGYRNLPADDAATSFQMTLSFYFPTATPIQALEFTEDSWVNGTRYEWAMQWEQKGAGLTSPQWRLWTGSGGWSAIGSGLHQTLAAGTWHTLTISGSIISGLVHYNYFTIDGQQHSGLTPNDFAPRASSGNYTSVGVQLDGDSTPHPYNVFIDELSFTHS